MPAPSPVHEFLSEYRYGPDYMTPARGVFDYELVPEVSAEEMTPVVRELLEELGRGERRSYEPGGTLRFVTARASVKADLIQRSGRLTLIAQTETLPYKYVAVQGPAAIVGRAEEAERRTLAHRYLGEKFGALYMDATADADDVVVEVIPERWRSTDFSKMLAARE